MDHAWQTGGWEYMGILLKSKKVEFICLGLNSIDAAM